MTDTAPAAPAAPTSPLPTHTIPAARPNGEVTVHEAEHGGFIVMLRSFLTGEVKALAAFATNNELVRWLESFYQQPQAKTATGVAMPGTSALSTDVQQKTATISGTAQAAPAATS